MDIKREKKGTLTRRRSPIYRTTPLRRHSARVRTNPRMVRTQSAIAHLLVQIQLFLVRKVLRAQRVPPAQVCTQEFGIALHLTPWVKKSSAIRLWVVSRDRTSIASKHSF